MEQQTHDNQYCVPISFTKPKPEIVPYEPTLDPLVYKKNKNYNTNKS